VVEAGPASTAKFERRQGRGAAHRNRAEPEAARQVHLSSTAIGGGLSGVGASGVGAEVQMPCCSFSSAARNELKNIRTSLAGKCCQVLQHNPLNIRHSFDSSHGSNGPAANLLTQRRSAAAVGKNSPSCPNLLRQRRSIIRSELGVRTGSARVWGETTRVVLGHQPH
jgi:hypothetical protein